MSELARTSSGVALILGLQAAWERQAFSAACICQDPESGRVDVTFTDRELVDRVGLAHAVVADRRFRLELGEQRFYGGHDDLRRMTSSVE